jgi:hypothetical protein
MSAQEIVEQIKSLPPLERAEVARFVAGQDDSWIPDEFKETMKDAKHGRCVDMETALSQTPPAHLQWNITVARVKSVWRDAQRGGRDDRAPRHSHSPRIKRAGIICKAAGGEGARGPQAIKRDASPGRATARSGGPGTH